MLVTSLPARQTPRVTFSALSQLLSAPPHRLSAILKDQKYPKPGPVFGYKKATEQAVNNMVHGTPLNLHAPGLRSHEVAALTALAGNTPSLPQGFQATGTATRQSWAIGGVDISAFPDVDLAGPQGRSGALKFYMKKEPLDQVVGASMASLLFYYQSQVLGQANAQPAYCMVFDVRTGMLSVAGGSHRRMMQQVQNTCAIIATLWPTV